MNNLLKLKLKFTPESKAPGGGERNLTAHRYTDVQKIEQLIDNLKSIKSYYKSKIGFGIVPIKIDEILSSQNSEIKFVLYETSQSYKTANYAIPVPKNTEGKYPYIARATLCYFPKCRREQGVDYTDRELSLKFGKIDKDGDIVDINKNVQDDCDGYATERKSRLEFRKWENTKFISSLFHNNRSLSAVDDKLWGFCVTSKERVSRVRRKNVKHLKFY